MHILPAHRTAHSRAYYDQGHDRCDNQERLDLHPKNNARRLIVILVRMFAGVMMPTEQRLFDDRKLV